MIVAKKYLRILLDPSRLLLIVTRAKDLAFYFNWIGSFAF